MFRNRTSTSPTQPPDLLSSTKPHHQPLSSLVKNRFRLLKQKTSWIQSYYHHIQQVGRPLPSPQPDTPVISNDNRSIVGGETRTSSKKRVRPGKDIKRWALNKKKASAPLEGSSSINRTEDAETHDAPDSDPTINNNKHSQKNQEQHVYFYFVPPHRQFDPNPSEVITTQKTLQHYHHLTHGTCIAAPRGGPAFCKVKYVPFASMSPEQIQGWEKLVCHFFDRTNYVEAVKNNGPQMAGDMWADGWRKCSKKESFGRYCSVGKLVKMMRWANYNPRDEATSIKEASDFIAIQLQHLAPGVFESYRETLISNNLPSMAHMEYPLPYDALDFASFLTFTMYNFHNGPHKDSDANNWTLVCWIPIFNPRTASDNDPILADEGFDMLGVQFSHTPDSSWSFSI
ncbi:Leucine-zipper-like transcriptional regulator 1 [Puccinia graminis f. sp. tritici]|uniref:Leucine-zipper-like transcriptional regulator 1 n=1 Tax=Puccinia graminis f. sp. tritici TaxID=56615 RepID=A0A5B0S2R8_PUCGR|nr:Leucine-zipper-like transcriptional regulator 1 [Puccinia graminis f. sp. tritici]KAA1131829.1 Leucine-zipper-like transcriptional regulator 1 [Puccinia graminis f. sp. tritici]